MSFQLHVWGPAFGLESIDAECLAAIAAFRHIFPNDAWSLIASNNTYLSPDHTLPALFHDGTWTSGYMNIISYVIHHITSYANQLADNDLTPQTEADLLAYSSFLTTRGSGLVALSLYASPHAWVELTRPAYSGLLPFPLTWTIPSAIRAAAIEKAENLGMGYLAAEAEADEADAGSGTETTSTGFMRLRERLGPRKSMRPEQTAAIRFTQLATDFFTTLDDLRGSGQYLLRTSSPSSLDFLAYGYLALMNVQTPYPILATCLTANRCSIQFLQMMKAESQNYILPRREPKPRGLPTTLGIFADGAIENIAGAGESWKRWRRGGINSAEEEKVQDSTGILLGIGGAVVSLAAVGAAVLFRGLSPFGAITHRFEAPREEKGLYRFGEIGAMLDSLPMFDQPPAASSPVLNMI
ncbi:outer mitochondrial membrane transport complex protein-domain-containing protein [Xylaria flabelliformis]|nr:outer mitochondrial membrane transport complex protein-domain-containing protein [Xylaria flabelliformis]